MIDSNALTVCIDFKNPEAYLAWAPTCAWAEEKNVEITWLPFVGPHPKVPDRSQPNQEANRGTLHRRMRFEYRQQNIMRYSGNLNLNKADLNREIDSGPAAIGLLWCKQVSNACAKHFIDTVFAACWQHKMDIADPDTIRNAIASSGAEVEQFDTFLNDSGLRQLAGLRQQLEQHGVFDTPFYLLKGEGFLGRQHLPMIQWLLSNKQGIKPI